jgi:EF hand
MKPRHLLLSVAVLAIGAGGALSAFAQPPQGRGERHQEHRMERRLEASRIDANGDKFITRAESQAEAERVFADLDDNHDGKLDAADHGPGGRQAMHRSETRDGQRVETREEVVIEREEHHGGPGHHGGPRPPMFAMIFANSEEADRNGDNALSKDEFVTQQLRFFDAADVNGDGKIKFDPPPMMAPPEPPEAPQPPLNVSAGGDPSSSPARLRAWCSRSLGKDFRDDGLHDGIVEREFACALQSPVGHEDLHAFAVGAFDVDDQGFHAGTVCRHASVERETGEEDATLLGFLTKSHDEAGDMIVRRGAIDRQIDVDVRSLAPVAHGGAERREGAAQLQHFRRFTEQVVERLLNVLLCRLGNHGRLRRGVAARPH